MDQRFQGLQTWLLDSPMPRPPVETWESYPEYRKSIAVLEARYAAAPQKRAAHFIAAQEVHECCMLLRQSFVSNLWGCGWSAPTYDAWWQCQSEAAAYDYYYRCGICGTDLAMTRGKAWDYGPNTQLGHEYAGEIIEVGRKVEKFSVGERIAVLPSVACGGCDPCRKYGNNLLCQSRTDTAMHGFAELARVPASVATKLPSTLSMADGALIEPLAISLYGVKLSRIEPGERVLVLGGGTVALYAIYWARRLGAGRIVAMSRSNRRAALALEMGADEFITYGENEPGEVVQGLGGAPQLVYECVGAEGLLQKALTHAGPFCRVISLGFCTSPDPVIPAIASYKCASIQFSVGYSMTEFLYIADQMDKGHCDPKAIISSEVPLSALAKTMASLRGPNTETKVHVRC